MRYTFRLKLLTIVGTATLAFVTLIAVTSLLERHTRTQLALIAEHHIPHLELGPKLNESCTQMRRGLQDAVAAQDPEALEATRELKNHCIETIQGASALLPAATTAALVAAIVDYYGTAYDVSRRLLAGETGEALVQTMEAMQRKHRVAEQLITQVSAFDQRELTRSFEAAAAAQDAATRARLVVSASCLTIVLLLSLWMSRGMLQSLSRLGAGFARFGRGDLSTRIQVESDDEFGALGAQANEMARNLDRLIEERDRRAWIETAHAGLVVELRENLAPDAAARNATRFLARYLEAPAAALYWLEDGHFRLLGHYAAWNVAGSDGPLASFRLGEGLIGQCAAQRDVTEITDIPADFFPLRTGLGQAAPHTLLIVPLIYLDQVTGVLELASLSAWSARARELLPSVRETLAISIEVAHARAEQRKLLLETQQQAERLARQEDALRASNRELQQHQVELRSVNLALTDQAVELEAQRKSLEQSNRELLDARNQLVRKADELTRVSAYKSQFLTNMSHELRTPLNSMLVLSSILAENDGGQLTSKQIEYARTIHHAGKDLLALINQVLDLAKVEAGKQDIRLAPVALEALADHARRIFEPLARDKHLSFEVDLNAADLPPFIVSDAKRIAQIMNNLLGNAIKFTERGTVTLRIGRPHAGQWPTHPTLTPSETLCIAVSDTGVGIPAEHQARIFTPFEQLEDNPDRRYGGTGLGLGIARELARLLGGELSLQSEPGVGSTFSLLLPFVAPASSDTTTRAEAALERAEDDLPHSRPAPSDAPVAHDSTTDTPAPFDGLTILLADDDMRTVFALCALLEPRGVKVLLADAEQSIAGMLSQHPEVDLVLLAAPQPGRDAAAIIRQLGADRPPRPAVVVMSAQRDDEVQRCLDAGALDCLLKPISAARLEALLGGLDARSRRAGAA